MVLRGSKMDRWDDLRLFLAVARAGTLSSAATKLGLNVSTIHRRLAALEESAGAELFEKGPRGYRLTHAGEALLPKAEEVEEAVLAATRTVVGHDQQAAGEVRITLPLVLVSMITPHLAAFTAHYKRVRPVLQAADGLLDLKRDTDIALRATREPPTTAVGRNLVGIAWGHYASTEGADLADPLPWIHYVGMDHNVGAQWRKKEHGKSKPLMLVRSLVGMHAVLTATRAQGMLPCFVGDRDPRLRRMGPPVAMNRLWLLIHADLRRSARVRALVDFLVPRLQADKALFEGA